VTQVLAGADCDVRIGSLIAGKAECKVGMIKNLAAKS